MCDDNGYRYIDNNTLIQPASSIMVYVFPLKSAKSKSLHAILHSEDGFNISNFHFEIDCGFNVPVGCAKPALSGRAISPKARLHGH